MAETTDLHTTLIVLLAAVAVVPVFRQLGASAVLGYLVAGVLIMQALVERRELVTAHGRIAFSILLFQDLAVVGSLSFLACIRITAPSAAPGRESAPPFFAASTSHCAIQPYRSTLSKQLQSASF